MYYVVSPVCDIMDGLSPGIVITEIASPSAYIHWWYFGWWGETDKIYFFMWRLDQDIWDHFDKLLRRPDTSKFNITPRLDLNFGMTVQGQFFLEVK